MSTRVAENKYSLRSLHQEIDLFDRKLAHLALPGASPEEKAGERHLSQRREQLEKIARQAAADGVAFEVSELPRSFRAKDGGGEKALTAKTPEPVAPVLAVPAAGAYPVLTAPLATSRKERRHPSAFAGTSLDGDLILDAMRSRKKAMAAAGLERALAEAAEKSDATIKGQAGFDGIDAPEKTSAS